MVRAIKLSKTKYKGNIFRTNFITNARSTINVLSVIAILAVDFNIFPRRFAKTKSFGYSLMDTGVGLFIYSNGIVAPEAGGQKDSIKKCIKSSLPILLLGVARFIFVKQIDYNVPISEYGVHWNFFITLGFTKIFTSFILNVVKVKYIYINAIFIIVAHEVLLQTGLQKFALTNIKRDNFLVANKEGLVSCLGYICIYLFSVYFGYLLNIRNSKQGKISMASKFVIGSFLSLIISLFLQNYFGISRRLANSAYCFWILFIGIFMTGLYYLGQIVQEFIFRDKLPDSIYSPLIFEAVNYNGLLFFLIGNVLTGLINMTFNTLTINDSISLIILVLYIFINCFVVTVLYCKQIKLKL
ncbi:hypothetical protein NQ314_006387 [Rhamnusium bicolor]|uniref:Phosphatidylinositol-glycan biosynthesis class W protein n=1 Tax=Rhamnusium bicolor TaxID=1586634 RepID=A0AAV8Z586_9CUCU|nr:hypothetical protein NQ314_006387 [Rhamnusium bicolor]